MNKLALLGMALALPFVAGANNLSTCSGSAMTYATWTAGGFGCEVGGVEFTNFAPGSLSNTTTLLVSLNTVLGVEYITLNFQNGDFTQSYTGSYNVTIDTTAFGGVDTAYQDVTSATAATQQGSAATDSLTLNLSNGATGQVVYSDVAGNGSAAPPTGVGIDSQSFTVTDTYAYGSGVILNNSNTFTEQDTFGPEPSTMILMGGALIGLGAFARKRRKNV